MKICLASDHAGGELKKEIIELLEEMGHEIIDKGPFTQDAVDLSDYIYPAALEVASKQADRGVSGSILCNIST